MEKSPAMLLIRTEYGKMKGTHPRLQNRQRECGGGVRGGGGNVLAAVKVKMVGQVTAYAFVHVFVYPST